MNCLRRVIIAGLVSLTGAGVPTVSVCAQAPRPLAIEVTSANTLSAEQRQQVEAYASYWGDQLSAEDIEPVMVMKSRDELTRPLRAIAQPSRDFRFTYTRALEDSLERTLGGADTMRAVNAAIVLRHLGTERAQGLLLSRAIVEKEQRWPVRLAAVRGVGGILGMANAGETGVEADHKQINAAARRLLEAVRVEDHPLVLRHIFEAMSQADTTDAQQNMIEAMGVAVQRMNNAAQVSTGQIEAITSAINRMLNRFVTSDDTTQLKAIGMTLGPVLRDFLALVREQWEPVRRDRRTNLTLDGAIQDAENLLRRIDREVNRASGSPSTQLHEAWTRDDKPRFERDLNAWSAVVSKAPYQPVNR